MSHMTPAPLATSDTESGPPATASTPRKHPPVLITKNQVAFGTAAAAPVGSTRRRWLDTTLTGGLGRILAAVTLPGRSTRTVRLPISRRRGCLGRWTDCDGA
jgi:hypothetical protein